jgi:membrane protein
VRRLLDRLLRTFERAAGEYYGSDGCPQLAAAISYHVLFALFPFLLLLVSILGLVLQDDSVRQQVIDWITQSVPLSEEANLDLEDALSGLATPLSAAGLISFVALLWSASGLSAALQTALNRIWKVDRGRPPARAKLVDFAIVVAGGLLVLVSFGLTIVIQVVTKATDEAAADLSALDDVLEVAGVATEILIPFALTFAVFVLLFRYVPATHPRFADVWVGALFAAIAFEAVKTGFAFYLANFSRYNLIYGSLGAVIAFLFFVYLSASFFLLGAEVAAAWPGAAEAGEGPGTPLKQKVRGFVRGLFVRDDERPADDG